MKKLSKTDAEKQIKKIFGDVKNKSPKEIKKIKKLAMSQNIQLKELRKKFCKKCYSPDLKIRGIKNKIKTIECKNCGKLMKWKI
jgi:RNase P subunit RPR2